MGPNEVGSLFYAGSKTAFSCLGVMIWSHSMVGKQYVAYVSRCIDKGQHYALAVLYDVLDRLDLSGYDGISAWSDCGGHFRGYSFASSLAVRCCVRHSKHLKIQYGCEAHCKSLVDSFFGRMQMYLKEERCRNMISSVGDVALYCNLKAAECKSGNDTDVFREFLPADRMHVNKYKFREPWPKGIKSSHQISFTLNDDRRRGQHLWGRGLNSRTLTGVTCGMHSLPSLPAGAANSWLPELAASCAKHQLEDSDAEQDVMVPIGTRTLGGWKLAFRTEEPEVVSYEKFVARLHGKRVAMQCDHRIAGGRRR
jgi:hypothetical protein